MAVVELRGRVMASELHVVAVDPEPGQLDDALAELERLEGLWSRFLPSSDIGRLNALTGGAAAVDDATMILVATMIEAWRATDGVFDPSVLPALVDAGYATSTVDASLHTVLGGGPQHTIGLEDVELDPVLGMVRLPRGTALDPGGLGKGLAADLVVARMLAGGAIGALVSIGGDLSMAGVPPQRGGWNIVVEQPDRPGETLCQVMLDGGGVATSSTRSRRWWHGGREVHHLIDPRTGVPSTTDLASATVIAPTGWQAEAHATAALAGGLDHALAHFARHGLSGIVVGVDGRMVTTPDLDGVLA